MGRVDLCSGTQVGAGAAAARFDDASFMARFAALATRLVDAVSVEDAVREALGFCADVLGVSAVACVEGSNGSQTLVAAGPLDREDRSLFERQIHDRAAGDDVCLVDDPPLVLAFRDPSTEYRSAVDAVAHLLAAEIRQVEQREAAAALEDGVDLRIAVAAHELCGPLLGARAVLEYLSTQQDDSGGRMLRRTADELTRLSEQVDHLLRWSATDLEVTVEPVEVGALLTEVAASSSFERRSERGEDRVRVRAPARVRVCADVEHLRIAVGNLIRNALAYSPAFSPVDVTAQRDGDAVRIVVTDHGSGISDHDGAHLFEPFVRGDGSRHGSGAGLGLFITKRIVDAHDGTIAFAPGPDGLGTSFTITLGAA